MSKNHKRPENYNLVIILSFLFIILLLIGSLNNSGGFLSIVGFLGIGLMLVISFLILLIKILKNNFILKKEVWIYIFSSLFILSYIIGVFIEPSTNSMKVSLQVATVIIFFLGITYLPIEKLNKSIITNVITLFIVFNFIWWIFTGFIIPFQGIFLNSNTFGAFIVFLLGFFILMNSNKLNFLFIIITIMSIALVFSSNSRTTFLVVIVSIFTYILWPVITSRKMNFNLYYFFFTFIIIAITVIYPNLLNSSLGHKLNSLSQTYTGKNIFSGRQYIWSEMLKVIQEKPFLGHGSNAKVSDFLNSSMSAHNYYIQMSLQVGLIGSLMFFFLLLSIWNYLYIAKEVKNVRIVASIYVGILIYQVFEVSFTQYNLSLALLQWLIIGLGVNYTRKEMLSKNKINV